MGSKVVGEALTFDDVLLVPMESDVLPSEVDVTTRLTGKIRLGIPLLSAAMDTVTTSRLAIALAREGGLGVIHKNMTPREQAQEVDRVKRSESGMITDPVTLEPDRPVSEAFAVMREYHISGIPITRNRRLVGILTNRDLRFVRDSSARIEDVMTKEKLVTAPEGTTLEEAQDLLHRHRIEKLPVVDREGYLKGLITFKDMSKRLMFPNACKDERGRLRVGAAIGVGPDREARLDLLREVGVDVVVIDTAHGHSRNVLLVVEETKKRCPEIAVIAGNVATEEGAKALIGAGVDAVKVGVGPGASCTTRVVSGVGVPQFTAIERCAEAAAKSGVPVVADGGIKYSGDIVKAIGAGAESIMIGSLFAGTTESPGETVLYEGRYYKVYRGMGSLEAMSSGSKDRYFQQEVESASKLVPEGVEGRVPYRGPLSDTVFQMIGGLRSGMGYCGARAIDDLRKKARFVSITQAGLRESHPHDMVVTKEAPNYSRPFSM
ncbi:MAG: IMP dehydrogenase [Candidatus Eisenbacteria bacterium]|nr:IMP dehydrogenase [Candidatus Eisenbacteria bacterium]